MGWLSRSWWRTLELEEWLWLGLCYTSLGLGLLKLGGVLALSWWWMALPMVVPFLIIAALFVAIIIFKLAEGVLR